jgi:hypothetical protein
MSVTTERMPPDREQGRGGDSGAKAEDRQRRASPSTPNSGAAAQAKTVLCVSRRYGRSGAIFQFGDRVEPFHRTLELGMRHRRAHRHGNQRNFASAREFQGTSWALEWQRCSYASAVFTCGDVWRSLRYQVSCDDGVHTAML